MAFGGLEPHERAAPMAEINMTPLIDVMLVLLVIFIITAPLMTHAVRLDLPHAQSAPAPATPAAVTVSINGANRLFWNDVPVDAGQLQARFAQAAQAPTPPEIRLRADRMTRYETVAQVMAAAQQAGLTRLGFVTQPDASPSAQPQAPR